LQSTNTVSILLFMAVMLLAVKQWRHKETFKKNDNPEAWLLIESL
jgi:hypothetical protein